MESNVQIQDIEQFRAIKSEWNDVWLDSTGNTLFLSFEFIELWYNCFAKPDQVRVFRATDRGKTIGFLPLVMKPECGIRVLSSLTNNHCFLSDALVRSGYEDTFPELILKEILCSSEPWDMLRYGFSYSFSQFPGLFKNELLELTGYAWRRAILPTYQVRFDKTFDRYLREDLSSTYRRTFLKKKSRLAKAGQVFFRHYRKDEAIQKWNEFKRIEDSGWKGEAGSSIARLDSGYNRYYDGLLDLLSTNDTLHLYFLELDGRNIAGAFGYEEGNIFHYAKTGYDEIFEKLSPSLLLTFHIIEEFMTSFPWIEVFHMFPWDYGYKHKFCNESSDCFETVIYNRTLRGQLARLYSVLNKAYRKLKE
jgi:CelD/BcsL family acetyltransferase involved in cellulose biosynthesis